MIIRICHGQTELALSLSQIGCDGGKLTSYDKIRLVIRKPHNKCPERYSMFIFKGCWPTLEECKWTPPERLPALIYNGFELNDHGDIVFRLDDQLMRRRPGRYRATIETIDGKRLQEFEIDLCNWEMSLDSIKVSSKHGCDGD